MLKAALLSQENLYNYYCMYGMLTNPGVCTRLAATAGIPPFRIVILIAKIIREYSNRLKVSDPLGLTGPNAS